METLSQFLDRVYVNFWDDVVLVWKSAKDKNSRQTTGDRRQKPEKWDISSARRYIAWLEQNQVNV